MTIESYIKDLLYRYECVVIPNFGAFLSQRKPAQIHETTQAFYPPKKSISFNAQLTNNDGVLINYIAQAEDISYQEAMQKVTEFVSQLRASLHEIGKIELQNIGTFYLENKQLVFQASYHHNYLVEAFGTEMYTSKAIVREQTSPKTVEKTATENKPEEKATPVKSLPKKEEEKRSIPIWRYAAVGLVAIGLTGFLGANWYSQEVKNHNIAEQQKATKKVEARIQEATFAIDNPLPEITFKVATQTGKYHVVAGAFRLKENATQKLTQLRDQGFKAREIGTNKYGLHQVIYSSYENRIAALKALRNIKKENNPNAWLLVQEL